MRRALSVLAMGLLALPVLAQQQVGQPHPAKDAVVRFLALTSDQVIVWDTLLATREATVLPLRQQLGDVETQLKSLLGGTNPDPTAVGALVIEGKGLREQIRSADVAYVDGFEGMLSEDQSARLDGIRKAARLEPLFPAFRVFGLLAPLDAAMPQSPQS